MSEQPCFHDQWHATEQLPAPTARLEHTAIKITWNEAAATTIRIQHQPIGMAGKIYGIHVQPRRWQERDAQFALNAELQMIFASSREIE